VTLNTRIRRLEAVAPPRRQANVLPTGNLTEFVRGLLTGSFKLDDIDRTDYLQMNLVGLFSACLVTLSPGHQAWCDADSWRRRRQDKWERVNLALTPVEFERLKWLAARSARL
jgi:hypothetical protein